MDYIKIVVEALAETQETCGSEPVSISASTVPINELPDFDSLRAVEFIMTLEEKCGFPVTLDDLVVGTCGPICVAEIARKLETITSEKRPS